MGRRSEPLKVIIYLDGKPVDEIPPEVKAKMSERLSRVVSDYFSQRPEEYKQFCESDDRMIEEEKEKKKKERERLMQEGAEA